MGLSCKCARTNLLKGIAYSFVHNKNKKIICSQAFSGREKCVYVQTVEFCYVNLVNSITAICSLF